MMGALVEIVLVAILGFFRGLAPRSLLRPDRMRPVQANLVDRKVVRKPGGML
jgi:hypothetical protein